MTIIGRLVSLTSSPCVPNSVRTSLSTICSYKKITLRMMSIMMLFYFFKIVYFTFVLFSLVVVVICHTFEQKKIMKKEVS